MVKSWIEKRLVGCENPRLWGKRKMATLTNYGVIVLECIVLSVTFKMENFLY